VRHADHSIGVASNFVWSSFCYWANRMYSVR
jgi:hypothetical protein